jgi:TonB family protein
MTMAVRENWYRRIPEADRDKTICLAMTFILHKDGQVSDMKVERPSGDEALDHSAWQSIEATEFFPALPGQFQGDHLAFRFNFVYNPALHLQVLQVANEPPTIASTSADGPVYTVGHGITAPRGTYMPSPEYSDKGRRKKIQGTVILQIVVTPEGAVRDAKVVTGLEPSLDEQALRAVSNWKFQPAKKDGVPVAVQLMTETQFHLY